MKSLFVRGKIRGVTFHRTGGVPSHGATPDTWRVTPELRVQVNGAVPSQLCRADIHRLLGDFGRQELHSLVSECVEQCGRWRQILRTLERSIQGTPQQQDELSLSDSPACHDNSPLPDDADLLLASRNVYRLWRHRLDILELIAQGQSTHHFEMVYSSQRRLSNHRFE